jgi:hypothetical protein
MAVMIDEVQVEVTDTPSQPVGPPAQAAQQQKLDLLSALERVHERQQRLKAD